MKDKYIIDNRQKVVLLLIIITIHSFLSAHILMMSDNQIRELEEAIQSLTEQLERTNEITCPTLKSIAQNYLQVLLTRAKKKLEEAHNNATEPQNQQ